MFTTLRVRDLILFVISILSIIGLLIYIPFAEAEIPNHFGLSPEQDNSELSLNDGYSDLDLLDSLHLSFVNRFENIQLEKEIDIYTNPEYTDEIKEKDQTEITIIPEYPTERGVYLVREGMPKNTRHLKEGYWIGALPDVHNIQVMKERGIKVILTLTNTKRSWIPVKNKINELGIEHIVVPIGTRFPRNTSFYDTLLNYDPNEIFIHCDHGSDRSGTMVAYLLARRNHWPIQRALLAMVSPNKVDVNGLKKILKQYGYEITQEDLFYQSIYSGASNGGSSGIKVRNEGYQRLVSTMLVTFNSTFESDRR